MIRLPARSLILAFTALPSLVWSHDLGFLTSVEGDHHPGRFHGTFSNLFEFERVDGEDILALSPGIAMGLHEHIAFSLSAHFADESGQMEFESALPAFQFIWHPADESIHLHFGIGYQFAETSHGGEEDDGFRSAVHSHGLSLLTGSLEADYRFGETLVSAGIIGTRFEDDETGFGYRARILRRIAPATHFSLGAFGDFDSRGYHEASGSLYFLLQKNLQLSATLAFGLSDLAPDRVVRLGVTCGF